MTLKSDPLPPLTFQVLGYKLVPAHPAGLGEHAVTKDSLLVGYFLRPTPGSNPGG